MRRNQHIDNAGAHSPENRQRCIAFHEAGHAAAIYLNNRAREIPPLLFSLKFNEISPEASADFQTAYENYIACVEGGRLLHTLPATRNEAMDSGQGWIQGQEDWLNAFEADVINLLAGPLAEAKYVAETDDEIITHRLIDPPALENYGGAFDLALVNDYMQCFSIDPQLRDHKLNQLHQVAFNFINDYHNWRAITKLAGYILTANKNMICYEEVAAILGEG